MRSRPRGIVLGSDRWSPGIPAGYRSATCPTAEEQARDNRRTLAVENLTAKALNVVSASAVQHPPEPGSSAGLAGLVHVVDKRFLAVESLPGTRWARGRSASPAVGKGLRI